MNRNEEYSALMQELESPVSGLENTLRRAQHKKIRRHYIIRPLATLAATFLVFVGMVNFCTPVASACSKIPILKHLAEAVTFSRSLSDAVENEYVQSLFLTQTDGDVTATVEYLIVDQKQVNVFFTLESEVYGEIVTIPTVLNADGSEPGVCGYHCSDNDGSLRHITIDYMDGSVPDSIRLQLDLKTREDFEKEGYIAQFDFLLEFDPTFTATGKIYSLNQTLVLDNQEIIFEEIEIYPTHLRVNIGESPDNTAWLNMLYFYIETDDGEQFNPVTNGIVASGTTDSQSMTSFRCDSSYFYDAEQVEIVVTGAEWRNKDMGNAYVNLVTGETRNFPETIAFHSAFKEDDCWQLELTAEHRQPDHYHQILSQPYYDADGKEYEITSWSTTTATEDENIFHSTYLLVDYPYDEVWLCPHYSHEWFAETPLRIPVTIE